MAQRRMFSKTITSSSSFLMMPSSAQNLYFHFGMNADDDGFCEHFPVMRMTDSKPDDLKILQVRGFIHVFDDKVLVIKDWKENNYIQKDRYTPSKYLRIYEKEIKQLSEGVSNVYKMDTQVRLGKVRLGKVKEDLASPAASAPFNLKERLGEMKIDKQRHIQLIGEYLEEKKVLIEDYAQLQVAIKRHLRAAMQLSKFSDKQIGKATLQATKEYPDYTLETLVKILTR